MQPRPILVTLLSLIAGTVLVTARAQSVGSPDHAAVAVFSANPVQANPFESEVTSLEARLLQAPAASSPIVFYGSSSIPGEGRTDWVGPMRALKNLCLKGYLTMEIGLDSRSADQDPIARSVKLLK